MIWTVSFVRLAMTRMLSTLNDTQPSTHPGLGLHIVPM